MINIAFFQTYEKKLSQYKDSLESVLPASSEHNKKARIQSGANDIQGELESTNQRYQHILSLLHGRLVRLQEIFKNAGVYFPVSH